MEWSTFINNAFLYLLSLSNTLNYIFYFPFILFYLIELDEFEEVSFIKIYIFFIIYDLVRNIFITPIQKLLYCIGFNKKISFDLIILFIINIALFYLFFHFENKRFILNITIIARIIISLMNISNLFISKIIKNTFEKEMIKKLIYFEFYEKLNNFIVFIIIFIFIDSFKKMYIYFFISSLFNLFFIIIYLLMFRCHDEKKYSLYEEQELNKLKNNNKYNNNKDKKNLKLKNAYSLKNIKTTISTGDYNSLSKSNNKEFFHNNHRKISSEIIVNNDLDKKKLNNLENKKIISDIENNDAMLSTNNNQIMTNKESINIDINNNDNMDNNIQNKELYMINNIPITSSNRVLNEDSKSIVTESKNENIVNKKKWIYTIFILTPSKFLIYLFLIMLFLKTYSLKNIYKIKIHLIFYFCYFLTNILIYPLNKEVFSRIIKSKKGRKVMYILSFIFAIPACIGYIYLILDNKIINEKMQLVKYILFFVLNFILKESLFILLRIFYLNIITIGFSKKISKQMKEISNILACLLFLGYNISLLFIRNDTIIYIIIKYILYYFLPLFFLIIFFIYIVNI